MSWPRLCQAKQGACSGPSVLWPPCQAPRLPHPVCLRPPASRCSPARRARLREPPQGPQGSGRAETNWSAGVAPSTLRAPTPTSHPTPPPTPQRPGNAEEQSEARAARLLPGRKEQASLINDWAVIAAGCALPAVCDGLSRPFWRQWPNVGALGLRAQGPRAPSITGSRQSRGGSIPAPARSLQTCALPTARAAASLRGAGVSTRVPSALGSRGPGSGQLPWPGQGPQVAPL